MTVMNRWIVFAGIAVGLLLVGCQAKDEPAGPDSGGSSVADGDSKSDQQHEPDISHAAQPVDLSLFTVPVYPGSVKEEGMEDRSSLSGELVTMVVSRSTTDSLDKVKSFYKDEVDWSDAVEQDDGAGFNLSTEDGEEGVTIYDEGDKRVIVMTKLIDNREDSE